MLDLQKSTAYAKYLEYKAKAESEKASAYAAATKAFEEKKKEFEKTYPLSIQRMEGTNMSGKEVEIIGSNTASAISYAQNIENGMKDSLNQAKDLKSICHRCEMEWKKREMHFLSYLDLIIQYNSEMVEAFEGHTKALKELDKSIQTYGDKSEVMAIKQL